MDRFEAMSLFLAVVDAGSISGAARKLRMPVATASRRISDLERRLKAQLFTRSSRQISLTDAGHSFVVACRRIVREVGEAEQEAAGEHRALRGKLLLSAPIALGRLYLLPIVADFLKEHPAIDARLALSDRRLNLIEDRIDVAVRVGRLLDSGQIAKRVGTARRVVCASPSYLESRGIPRHPRDLIAHDCVTFENTISSDAWRFSVGSTEQEFQIHSRLVANTAEAAVDAAVVGLGLARAMDYQVDAPHREGALRLVLERFALPPAPVHLIYGAGTRLPMKTRAFLDFAAPRLKRMLRELVEPRSSTNAHSTRA
jgi:DNA-binding transcriptional LysR family regulator